MKRKNPKNPSKFIPQYIAGRSPLNSVDWAYCQFLSLLAWTGVLIPFVLLWLAVRLIFYPNYYSTEDTLLIGLLNLSGCLLLIFILVLIWNLPKSHTSFYKLLEASLLSCIKIIGKILLINPLGVLVILPIFRIMALSNNSYIKHYKFAHLIESFKVSIAFFSTISTIAGEALLSIFNIIIGIALISRKEANDVLIFSIIMATIIIPAIITLFINIDISYEMIRSYFSAKNLKDFKELPPEFENSLKLRLDSIIKKLPLNKEQDTLKNCRPRYLIETDNYSATPSMIESHWGRINIILPLGYLKALKSTPEAADAMLAHELAHFLHKDSNFLLWVKCYYKYMRSAKIYFFINLFIAGFNMEVIFVQSKDFINPLWGYYLSNIIVWFMLDKERLEFLRRRVEYAEGLADVFASIAVSPLAVNQFLKEYTNYEMSSAEDFDSPPMYPPVSDRLQISRYYRPVAKETSAEVF